MQTYNKNKVNTNKSENFEDYNQQQMETSNHLQQGNLFEQYNQQQMETSNHLQQQYQL
jgi:hypothetical protein